MRGLVAEFLVARALETVSSARVEWDAVDVVTPDGIKVEVKSSAWLQSWHQDRLSAIGFGIAPTAAWEPKTNRFETERKRQADVYVFCLLDHKDKQTVDPLDVDQWRFSVLPTRELDRRCRVQKRISLATLLHMEPTEATWVELAQTVRSLGGRSM